MAASILQHRQRLLRGLWGECIAEFWGTFILMVFGEAIVVTVTLFGVGLSSPLFANYFVNSFAWGLAVCFGIYTAGAISGAHINPAVTLAFALRRDFPWKHVIPYWVSQCLGAFVAAAIVYLNYSNLVRLFEQTHHITRGVATGSYAAMLSSNAVLEAKMFFTFPAPWESVGAAFGDEVLATALLLFVIFAVIDLINQPPQANLAPLIVGMVVVLIGNSYVINSGYALNPARDFGPRVFAYLVGFGGVAFPSPGSYWWVPIVAPLVGAVIGACLYDFTLRPVLKARGAQPSGAGEEIGVTVRELPAGGLVAHTPALPELPRHHDIDLVLFDLGGAIYDDECYMRALWRAVHELSPTVKEEDFWQVVDDQLEKSYGSLRAVLASRFISGGDRQRLNGLARKYWEYQSSALYPDVKPTLTALATRYKLGIVADSPPSAQESLRRDELDDLFTVIALSDVVGMEKPNPQFYQYALEKAGVPANRAVHVGNRLDLDVRPAKQLGMRTVWLMRGEVPPAPTPEHLSEPDAVLTSLVGLPSVLARLTGTERTGAAMATAATRSNRTSA
ncbi:MAG: MIP family channel protein [Ktedonobacteraceae bacterium]